MDMTQSVFAVLGGIAVKFATLEFAVSQLLARLVHSRNALIGGLVTRELPLERRLKHVGKLAQFRLYGRPEILKSVLDTLKRIDNVRIERNLFIHGSWVMDTKALEKGKVKCIDFRCDLKMTGKGELDWHLCQSREWTFQELDIFSESLGKLVMETIELLERLGQTTMHDPEIPFFGIVDGMPHAS